MDTRYIIVDDCGLEVPTIGTYYLWIQCKNLKKIGTALSRGAY